MNKSRDEIKQRHKDIIRILNETGKVYVSDLCDKFAVSDMTIRRDLAMLEREGQLSRFRGGATVLHISEPPVQDNPVYDNEDVAVKFVESYAQKISVRAKQKDMIAAAAATLINHGETVFMNSGTTCLYMLKYLSGKNVRIVSNNAAMALIDRPADTELTIAGGEHFTRTQSFVGPLAKNVFNNVFATKCILCVGGISSRSGITSSSMQETEINNLVCQQCSGKRIVVADGSKVGASQSFISCKVEDIDILITDKTANSDELMAIRQCGVQVIVVDE